MDDNSPCVDDLAQALRNFTQTSCLHPKDRRYYRRLAQAAIDALGLTEETQERPVANGNPCTCNRPDGKHSGMGCDMRRTDWIPHTRLVTPWTRMGGGEG